MDFECQFVCELRELLPAPALTIRTRTAASSISSLFREGFSEIAALLAGQGMAPAGPSFALYYNMDMEDLDVEFGFPAPGAATGGGRVVQSGTPYGKAVTTLYIGPYEEIGPVYEALMQWIDTNGLVPSGMAYEVYLNDPAVTPPEILKTQVHLLLG
jgi:effector-binding domain-containing protein